MDILARRIPVGKLCPTRDLQVDAVPAHESPPIASSIPGPGAPELRSKCGSVEFNTMEPTRPAVLFLNRSYWPDVEATGQLLTALCEKLSGPWDVRVLAGQPNAVSASSNQEMDDWKSQSVRHGVQIHRVPHLTLPKRRMIFKALNYSSFLRASRRVLRTIDAPDVVVFETDPFLLPFEARRLQRRTGCRMVGYLQDIYPDVAVALNKIPNNWAVRRLRKAMFSVYQHCDRMVVLSHDMKLLLVDGGVDPERIDIVPNWADTSSVVPIDSENQFRCRHELDDRFLVMYSGNLGLTQRLEQFVEAARLLSDDAQICFAFVGQGSQRTPLENLVTQLRLTNVRFFDYQPQEQLADSLSAADLHLVPLTRELSQCLMPSKLYGILAAGRPFLTNAVPESELHQLTVSHHVGVVVRPNSPAAIADAIRAAKANPELRQQMRLNARRLAVSEFTLEHSVSKFAAVLKKALN